MLLRYRMGGPYPSSVEPLGIAQARTRLPSCWAWVMKEAIRGVLAPKVGSLTDQMLRAVAGGRDCWA